MGGNWIKTLLLLVAMTALFVVTGWLIGGMEGMILALVVALATNVLAWWNSGKLVRRMQGAVELSRDRAPELYDMTAALAERAGLPMPALYVIETDQPNAFATGRDPQNGAVCVSTGLLRTLNRDEIAGVIAHELAHIRSRDTLIMTYAGVMAGAISMLSQYVFWFGGGRRDGPLGGLGLLIAAITAPIAALVIRMFISRTREYEADRAGAEISGMPLALASALKKINAAARRGILRRARRHPALAHLYIDNPLTGNGGVDSWFSTHPAVENRIAALMKIAQAMGQVPRQEQPRLAPAPSTAPPRRGRSGPWG